MPLTLTAIVSLIEAAVTDVPALVTEIQSLFASGVPTADQFAALRAKVAAESFAVPAAGTVTTTTTTTIVPPAPVA